MRLCERCRSSIKDSSGNTIANRLHRAGELCTEERGHEALIILQDIISALETNGGCKDCVFMMKFFKIKTESLI